LVGHRTTYGATFRALSDVSVGDVVAYRGLEYVLVEYTTARFDDPGAVLSWVDSATPTIVLQTSRDRVFAHLWRGVEIAVIAPPAPSHAPQPLELVVDAPSVRSHDTEAINNTDVDASAPAPSTPAGTPSPTRTSILRQ
jgi:hypothetical protein